MGISRIESPVIKIKFLMVGPPFYVA